ncbi:MAG: O-antigen ligase family protein [Pseudomonadota bacterium]|nr:O-antigen ligase family protein [Pseudomonadota bacterium]
MAIFLGVAVKSANSREKEQIPLITASGFLSTYPIVILDVMLAGDISSAFKTSLYAVEIYSRGTAITACLLVPVAVGLFRSNSKWFSIAFILLSLGMIFGFNMEASKLAIVCGVIIYFVVKWKPKAFWSLIILPIVSFFVFPFIFLTPISDRDKCWLNEVHSSGLHRILIYQFMTEKIIEKPWIGWGMDASRSIPGGSTGVQSVDCIKSDESRYILRLGGTKTLHPHNAGIQIWLELGLLGCLFLLFSICLLMSRMKEKIISDQGQAILASTFYCISIIYGISFGLWQSWLMFSMILVGSTILLLFSDHGKDPQIS